MSAFKTRPLSQVLAVSSELTRDRCPLAGIEASFCDDCELDPPAACPRGAETMRWLRPALWLILAVVGAAVARDAVPALWGLAGKEPSSRRRLGPVALSASLQVSRGWVSTECTGLSRGGVRRSVLWRAGRRHVDERNSRDRSQLVTNQETLPGEPPSLENEMRTSVPVSWCAGRDRGALHDGLDRALAHLLADALLLLQGRPGDDRLAPERRRGGLPLGGGSALCAHRGANIQLRLRARGLPQHGARGRDRRRRTRRLFFLSFSTTPAVCVYVSPHVSGFTHTQEWVWTGVWEFATPSIVP